MRHIISTALCTRASTAKKLPLGEMADYIKKIIRAQKNVTVSTS